MNSPIMRVSTLGAARPRPSTVEMVSGIGQYHTNEADPSKPDKKLTPYEGITIDDIRAMVADPPSIPKEQGRWLIPSTLKSRDFKEQERRGEFHMLWADLDKDPPPIEQLEQVLQAIVPGCEWLVYSSRSARADYQKARILIPLAKPISGADWLLCQEILNDGLEAHGITPDRVAQRAGQLCYLPNRGDYYTHRTSPGAPLDPTRAWADRLAAKRAAIRVAEEDARRRSEEARQRREQRSHRGEPSPIAAWNAAYTVEDMLLQSGYEQKGSDFRHPGSESGNYSASVKDGRVYSLSPGDPLYTADKGNGAHDAFSVYCVLEHGGDHKKAVKAAAKHLDMDYEEGEPEVIFREANKAHKDDGQGSTRQAGGNASGGDSERPVWHFARADTPSMLKAPPPPREFLMADRVIAGRGLLLVGLGGSSKTKVLYYWAIGAAIGRLPWDWTPGKRGSSILALTEDTPGDVHETLFNICTTMALTPEEKALVAKHVSIYPLAGEDFKLIRIQEGVAMHDPLAKALVEKAREAGDTVFIGIDPALGVTQGNELDQGHQRELGTLVDSIAIQTGATTALVAHATKGISGAEELGSHSSRGGGAITDAVRAEYTMRTMTAKEAKSAGITDLEERKRHVQLVATKGNHLPPSAFVPIWLRRGEGGTLAGAAIEFNGAGADDGLTTSDLKAHALLVELCRTHVPKLEDWRAQCAGQAIIKGSSPDALKKAMQRVIRKLLAHGMVKHGHSKGYYVPDDTYEEEI